MHLMIDLETLDILPSAAILEYGAVEFHLSGPKATGREDNPCDECKRNQAFLNLEHQLAVGRTESEATKKWWIDHPAAHKRQIEATRVGYVDGMRAIYYDTPWKDYEGIWSHGATFDIVILEHAFRQMGLDVPWSHRQIRDTRTLYWLAGLTPDRSSVVHAALEDAVWQASDVIHCYGKMMS